MRVRILLDQFHRNYSNYIRLIPQPRGWDKIGGDVSNVRMGGDVIDICSKNYEYEIGWKRKRGEE